MNKLFKATVLILFVGLAITMQSCSSEPGVANVNLEMKATTELSSINPSGRVMTNDLVFTDVLLGVTEIEFETLEEESSENSSDMDDHDGDGEDDNEEVEFEGNFVVDLIAGTSTPDFGVADIAPGIYEKLEIELSPILDGDMSVFVAFEFTPDGATEPVKYEYSNSTGMEFKIEDEGGFQLDENMLNQILVFVDLDVMFSGIDFSMAAVDSDGIVRINGSSNSDLAALIAGNLGGMMHGGEDEDGDGEHDDD
jgi:hypothetical protein